MRSFARNCLVATLTFSIGTVGTLTLRHLRRTSSVPIETQDSPASSRVEIPPPPRPGAAGKAVTKDGTPASFTSFSTSDGSWFTQWSEFHSSPSRARRAMDAALKHATQIIRREPFCDENGHPVGQKVIATFSAKYSYYGDAALLWTDGSTFRYVASSSLQNILNYDKGSPL